MPLGAPNGSERTREARLAGAQTAMKKSTHRRVAICLKGGTPLRPHQVARCQLGTLSPRMQLGTSQHPKQPMTARGVASSAEGSALPSGRRGPLAPKGQRHFVLLARSSLEPGPLGAQAAAAVRSKRDCVLGGQEPGLSSVQKLLAGQQLQSGTSLGHGTWLLGPQAEGWMFIHDIQPILQDISRAGAVSPSGPLHLSAAPPSRPGLLPSQPSLLGQAAQQASWYRLSYRVR